MTEPVAIVEFDPTEGGKYCGAKTRPGAKHPYCHQIAGHRTDHVRQGRCRLHGGVAVITSGRGSRNTSRYGRVKRPNVRELIEQMEAVENPLDTLPELAAARAMFVDFIERYDEWREAFLAWHASYSAKWAPIGEEKRLAFIAVVDEHEILLRERGDEATESQLTNLKLARDYIDRIADPILLTTPKPREVLDVSAAIGHLDTISKLAEREWKRLAENAISRTDFYRLMRQFAVEVAKHVRDAIPDAATADRVLKLIRNDWNTIATRAA